MIFNTINKNIIKDINNTDEEVLVVLGNTKRLNHKLLNKIKNKKCSFKILGGIKDIPSLPRYEKRVIYSLSEMKKIILKFEEFEKYLPNDKLERVLYIYDYIRKNIVYDAEEKNDKLIRSLRVIYTKRAVCSGFSLLLKELLERQNIKCLYIKRYNHIWNEIIINRCRYEVDLTWDACVYNKTRSSNIHYFANNRTLKLEHHSNNKTNNYFYNDLLNEYNLKTISFKRNDNTMFNLTLLPIGKYRKYYLYEDERKRIIVSSDDDIEIIYSKKDKQMLSTYANCFFTKERIEKYSKNYYLGYLLFLNNCFYKKKNPKSDKDIIIIKYDKDIIIDINNKKYLIDSTNKMVVI